MFYYNNLSLFLLASIVAIIYGLRQKFTIPHKKVKILAGTLEPDCKR